MPAFEVECDIAQGFALDGPHHTVGYLTRLGELTPDLPVTLPPPDAAQPVVAVLGGAAWSTASTGDITLRGVLSPANAGAVIRSPERLIRIGFVVFAFDEANGVYYRAFESYRGYPASGVGQHGAVYGVLTKATADEWTVSPARTPQPQQILLHPSATTRVVMPWGRA